MANDLIQDYKDGMGLTEICKKYKLGKLKAKDILRANNVPIRKRGKQAINTGGFAVKDYKIRKYIEHEGFHYVARDRNDGYETSDYMNLGGHLTTHIEKVYGITTPTLYERRMYYMKNGNYWWEQWFDIIEIEDVKKKKCPYCDWETSDLENKSGAFCQHLMKEHGMTKEEYLKEHMEDREYFSMANKTLNLQTEENEDKFVVCKICGKKLRRISSEHLSKHNITKREYIEKYGKNNMICKEYGDFLVRQMESINLEMEHSFSSNAENEIMEWLQGLGVECDKDRKILGGRELDIYIPSHRLAIEFNGNVWHSEFFSKKDKNYHLRKLNECNDKGIGLIQICEDEYMLHKDIVLSKIRHTLGLDYGLPKIQGRKCTVDVVPKGLGDAFLEINHIQGSTNCSIMLGAFCDGELAAVMAFLNENDGRWNLVRYASRIDARCQGVASKIFTEFVKKYNPIVVRSFADRRWTIGGGRNLYTNLGFTLDSCTKPNYTYFNSKVDRYRRFHKFNFRKERLISKYGFDQGMSELEMTRELGYDRIWDCGLFKYVWTRNV